jgi:predicted nucleic acid-binding protein
VVISYLDTSAAMKLLVQERETRGLLQYLETPGLQLTASWLLHTELHCAASRHPKTVDASSVAALLEAVILVDLIRGDLLTAAVLPGGLRSHDAIHLATALRIAVDEVITYDQELARACTSTGLQVREPGRPLDPPRT